MDVRPQGLAFRAVSVPGLPPSSAAGRSVWLQGWAVTDGTACCGTHTHMSVLGFLSPCAHVLGWAVYCPLTFPPKRVLPALPSSPYPLSGPHGTLEKGRRTLLWEMMTRRVTTARVGEAEGREARGGEDPTAGRVTFPAQSLSSFNGLDGIL